MKGDGALLDFSVDKLRPGWPEDPDQQSERRVKIILKLSEGN